MYADSSIEVIEIQPSLDIGSTNVTIDDDETLSCTRFFVASIDSTQPPIGINASTLTVQILDTDGICHVTYKLPSTHTYTIMHPCSAR